MKEKIKSFLFYDIEKNILNNITRVSIYLILILLILQILFYIINKQFLEIKDFITILWAISIFWYWYKKYERDKELEIIEKYTEKYAILINELYKKRSRTNYRNLFNLFYTEFYLKSKWYISDELWGQWEYWIKSDLKREFEKEEYKKIIKDIKEKNSKIESETFFEYLFEKSWKETDNCKIKWKSFFKYFNKNMNLINKKK